MASALTQAARSAADFGGAHEHRATAPLSATPSERTAAFEEIVRQQQKRIYRVLLGMLRDPDAADTLTQECFLRAYQNWDGFRGEARVGTWLVRIAINLAHDHHRNRRTGFWSRLMGSQESAETQATQLNSAMDTQATAERAMIARQDAAAVWAVAETLSEQQRAVFVLRFAEERSLVSPRDCVWER
ncbi:MAG: sigma-70 family RNA polymerase sigma factor [Acidobacteria bacterium]|nr:sigma-70 family RNA polymerase sigma factor [Acidobacteriota bacterium]